LTKTILLVDDEFGIVETLKELLESEGYRVVCASNGKDAMGRMSAEVPDLAVVDVMMPVMNGIEVLRAMRDSNAQKDVPVLLMSAVPRSVATQGAEALPTSGWSFIRKPFEFNDLLEAIKRMIGTPERQIH
jgi:CheY-like chemotaxis protein